MAKSNQQQVRSEELFAGFGLYVLIVAAALLLWPATRGPFLFDDYANLQNLSLLGENLTRSSVGQYLHAFVGNPGRPLSALSFLIDDQAWPASAAGFKRTNLLLHLLAGTLVFSLSRSLVLRDPGIAHRTAVVALATTALWLVSPMQLAATMLVVQRMNILSALFTMVGLICYLSFVRRGRPVVALVVLGFGAVLAFLCKENGVLAFAYAIVLNHTLLRNTINTQPKSARTLLHAGTALPLIALAAAMLLQSDALLASYQLRDFSLMERLMTQPRILVEYLTRILVPQLGGQGVFHDDYTVSTGLTQPLSTLPALAACAVMLVAGVLVRKRNPWLAFGILWFFAGHSLESTLLPLELYFEHRNYLPMLGPLLAIVALLAQLTGFSLRAGIAVVCVWIGLASFSVGLNAKAWGDELRLASVWHAENPESVRSTQFLARVLANRGQLSRAHDVLVSAYLAQPEKPELAFQIALLECTAGSLQSTRTDQIQRLASSALPSQSIDAAVRRLREFAQRGACAMTEGDWERLANNLLANPAYGRVGSLSGSLFYQKGLMAEHARDLNAAMYNYDLAYRYLGDARIPQQQALILWSAGLPNEALRYLRVSDGTPEPRIKRWMHDIRTENAKIRALLAPNLSSNQPGHTR